MRAPIVEDDVVDGPLADGAHVLGHAPAREAVGAGHVRAAGDAAADDDGDDEVQR